MAQIILVIGGARSGKSDFALQRAEQIDGRKCFVATCEIRDQEMADRVRKHRAERDAHLWSTIEEPLDVVSVIGSNSHDVYLVDCLTLWVSNVMAAYEQRGELCDETAIAREIKSILDRSLNMKGTVVIVSNEVGMGIVPDNALARRYRDLVGLCNKLVAAAAGEVVLVSCGLPIHIKQDV